MLSFRQHKDLMKYEATDDDVSHIDECLISEARRSIAPAAAAAVIYMQSTKIKSATQKIRAADTVEEKLDFFADTLERMNTKSSALAAMTYFLTKRK